MRLQHLAASIGFTGTTLVNPITSEEYSGPIVQTKNGTFGGVYLPKYDQDLFLGVRYAQVYFIILALHIVCAGQFIPCRK